MSDSKTTNFSDRELSVMREWLKLIDSSGYSSTPDWLTIGSQAGITDGNVARNAKYAFGSFKKKLGATGGTNEKVASTTQRKRTASDETQDTPSKKGKGRKGKGLEVTKKEEGEDA